MLSFTGKRWVVSEEARDPKMLVAEIAMTRDLCNGDSFSPSFLRDIGKAVERVRRAAESGECVGIFGDYDCDGITAVAQLVRFFRRYGRDPLVRLPHRERDGYGLKPYHVDAFTADGATLLIAVDTGVTAHDAVSRAHAAGMDVIVIDHHERQGDFPRATAMLHPICASPVLAPPPCAAGIVSLLIAALEGCARAEKAEDRVLAAIGTVADLMELRGGNRAIVREGLAAISSLPEGPLKDLTLRLASARSGSALAPARWTSRDIGFRVAPRLNAAGRMDDPALALRAILDGGAAIQALDELNTSRQSLVGELFDGLRAALPDREHLPPLIGVADEAFPPGVIGLLAGKLTEQCGRPSLVAHVAGDVCTASLRSIPAVHITELLGRSAHLLRSFGGHAQAAGCTFARERFGELLTALQQDVARSISPEDLVPTLSVDAILQPSSVTLELCENLRELEPFGQGNPEPRFLLPRVRLCSPRRIGREGKHLTASIGGQRAVGFGIGHLFSHCDQPLDIVCRLAVDAWNGRCAPQIFIEDVRCAHKKAATQGVAAPYCC